MAWFNESFSEGFSTLKGQISKITKEVLSDDPLAATSFEGRIKELDDECSQLKQELDKIMNENKMLKEGTSIELSDNQIQNICELENQLTEVVAERNELARALDEIDADHQREIQLLIKERDALKLRLKNTPSSDISSSKVEELNAAVQQLQLQNDILYEESKSKDAEIRASHAEVEKMKERLAAFELQLNHQDKEKVSELLLLEENLNKSGLELDIERKRFDNQLLDLECRIKASEETTEALRNENECLNKEKENLQSDIKHYKVLEAKLKQVSSDNIRLTNELEMVSQQLIALENQVKSLSDGNNQLKTELNAEQVVINNLLEEKKTLLEKLQHYEHLVADQKEAHAAEKSEMRNEKRDLKMKFNEVEEAMTNKVQLLTEEIEQLKHQLKYLEVSNKELLSKDRETESVMNQLIVENDENKKIRESLVKLKEENNALQQRVISYSKNENDKTAEDYERLKQKYKMMKDSMGKLKQEYLELNEKVGENAIKLEKENTNLKEEVARVIQENSVITNRLEEEKAQMERKLLNKEEEATSSFKQLQNEIDLLKEQLDACKTEEAGIVSVIEKERNETKEEMLIKKAETEEILADVGKEKEDLIKKIIDIENKYAMALTKNTKLKEKLEILYAENHKKGEDVKNKIMDAEKRLSLLQSTTENTITKLTKENSILQNELQEAVNVIERGTAQSVKLKAQLDKLEAEREQLVTGTLALEIPRLRGLVGRIRREFLQSPELVDNSMQEQSEELLVQSQTDDVKRLQQDISQMTHIIQMIDQGLTAIYQHKSQLEGDLAETTQAKLLLEKNIQEWAMAVTNRDQLIQTLTNDLKFHHDEKDKLSVLNATLLEEKKKIEGDKKVLEEKLVEINRMHVEEMNKAEEEMKEVSKRLNEVNRSAEEWKMRLEGLQSLYATEAKRNEELCRKKDDQIADLSRESTEDNSDCADESKIPSTELSELRDKVARLVGENSELKILIQQLRENIFMLNTRTPASNEHLQHKRSHSQVQDQREQLQLEHAQYQALLVQNQSLVEQEANLKKKVERLHAHLMEVEEHYTEEAMLSQTELNELRSKLATAEEQLRSSTTVYKSANVRSTQHVEALQAQLQLIGVQRKDLQDKLSQAEDNAQKQAAALASLQLVLEQFQLDKQRESQAAEERYTYQIELERRKTQQLESEIENLQQQLTEAKNGLKAGLRLGEQLEKKSQTISELEEDLKNTQAELAKVEAKLSNLSQSTVSKIDKSLVKNLVIGYLAAQGDHKNQALKILISVLELTQEERTRAGVTESQGGWLASLLHPGSLQSAHAPPTESLSQAFVRFLENESKPIPQLKLKVDSPPAHVTNKRAPLVLSDLVLPSVNPTPISDSNLNDVLSDR